MAENIAPYQPSFESKRKREMLRNPNTHPTKGRESNIIFKICGLDKLSVDLNFRGRIEKYEKENLMPRYRFLNIL